MQPSRRPGLTKQTKSKLLWRRRFAAPSQAVLADSRQKHAQTENLKRSDQDGDDTVKLAMATLLATASTLLVMASNLLAMASTLLVMAFNLFANWSWTS